jgi:hypothetical protein
MDKERLTVGVIQQPLSCYTNPSFLLRFSSYLMRVSFIFMRIRFTAILLTLFVALCGAAPAQYRASFAPSNAVDVSAADVSASIPSMTADGALATYQRRLQQQESELAAFSDTTIMQAALPDSSQSAEYELRRSYSAPNRLEFTPVRFTGDGFVKNNVLLRLLQAEVERVTKHKSDQTAITEENYKFSLKSVEKLDGRLCYVFQLKPRRKAVGLFKGRVFIDSRTGAIRRAEGTLVKSPSWWIRRVEFVQDFDEIGGFNLPIKLSTTSKVHVIGRTIVDVFHRDYKTVAASHAPPGTWAAHSKPFRVSRFAFRVVPSVLHCIRFVAPGSCPAGPAWSGVVAGFCNSLRHRKFDFRESERGPRHSFFVRAGVEAKEGLVWDQGNSRRLERSGDADYLFGTRWPDGGGRTGQPFLQGRQGFSTRLFAGLDQRRRLLKCVVAEAAYVGHQGQVGRGLPRACHPALRNGEALADDVEHMPRSPDVNPMRTQKDREHPFSPHFPQRHGRNSVRQHAVHV